MKIAKSWRISVEKWILSKVLKSSQKRNKFQLSYNQKFPLKRKNEKRTWSFKMQKLMFLIEVFIEIRKDGLKWRVPKEFYWITSTMAGGAFSSWMKIEVSSSKSLLSATLRSSEVAIMWSKKMKDQNQSQIERIWKKVYWKLTPYEVDQWKGYLVEKASMKKTKLSFRKEN